MEPRSAPEVRSTANRLLGERSPYLRQHAYNPVDWFPWGTEAFEKARREDKPIFLSIGYSTCHWCHVMARESFEDPEVGRLLDESFVSIKVDREERPDIDGVYMTVCQMMTGSGGWPLTVLLMPDRRPFFAGTYFPKHSRFGRPGLVELLERSVELWAGQRSHLMNWAHQAAEALQRDSRRTPGPELAIDLLGAVRGALARRFDERHGGFGRAPKFPTPHNLLFLLRHWHRTGDAGSLAMVEQTLRGMRNGGIYDQLGYGFHRYATDEAWLVPHFEKMLYDQALLAMAYCETFQATGRDEYAATAHEILTYLLGEMRSPEGAFYSGEDADSEGVEGKFYVWHRDELASLLSEDDLRLATHVFHVKQAGANILHLAGTLDEAAAELGLAPPELQARLESIRTRLVEARRLRVRPLRDEKVLADWNGLAIAALAKAAQALSAPDYATAAGRAADYLLERLRRPDGRLLHRNGSHPPPIPGYADDYAFVIWGLIELYAATFEPRRLEQALALNEQFIEHFWDPDGGGFFFVAADAEQMLVRRKEVLDSALPSGNSVAMLNLVRLARLTGRTDLEDRAAALGSAFSGEVRQAPLAHTMLLSALDYALGPTQEVVLAGRPEAPDTRALIAALHRVYLPRAAVLLRPTGPAGGPIVDLAPFTRTLAGRDDRAVAYVCQGNHCGLPAHDAEALLAMLGG